MNTDLHHIAQKIVANDKGLLAADESTSTIGKHFDKIGVENTEENRRAYRELLFMTVGFEQYISGVILYDETIRQSTHDGVLFVDVLKSKGVLPGVKVDLGTEPFTEGSAELVTKGLHGLTESLAEYARLGVTFTKWRAVVTIGQGIPTDECIRENMKRLAQYAKLVQEAGMVPMVEPEVLMDGAHMMQTCKEVTLRAQYALFEELERVGVDLKGIILKPNFIVPGKESGEVFDPVVSARETLDVLGETTPLEVPGVMFLSGGLSDTDAVDVLREVNRLREEHMWKLSFSYGRALQSTALKVWGGKSENVPAAQSAFFDMAKKNSEACGGK
jgi:fructose-bisphosphate aldolase, class I